MKAHILYPVSWIQQKTPPGQPVWRVEASAPMRTPAEMRSDEDYRILSPLPADGNLKRGIMWPD